MSTAERGAVVWNIPTPPPDHRSPARRRVGNLALVYLVLFVTFAAVVYVRTGPLHLNITTPKPTTEVTTP